MVRLFHSNRTLVLVLLPIIVGFYVVLNYFLDYHHYETPSFGLWGTLKYDVSIISEIIAPVLVFLSAVLLNVIYNRNGFMERNNYIVSLLYVVFMSFFHSFYFVDGLALAQIFMILALQQVFWLNQNEDARTRAFNIAFLVGVGVTLYPLLVISLPVLFWILWVFRPFVLRESLLMIIGFVIPLIYARVYGMFFIDQFDTNDFNSDSSERLMVDIITLASIVATFGLLSLKKVLIKIQQGSIRLRKQFTVLYMLSLLVIGILALDYFFYDKIQSLSMIFIVMMFVLPHSFGEKKPAPAARFMFYVCFFYSVGKFFFPFIQ